MPKTITPTLSSNKLPKGSTTKKKTGQGQKSKEGKASSPSSKKPKVEAKIPEERGLVRKKLKAEPRKVLYPEVTAVVMGPDNPLTGDLAKELLGWTVASENLPMTNDYDLKNIAGEKVKLLNNLTNRNMVKMQCGLLKQEQLRHRWYLNGEPIIIGVTGRVLNGQHTLVALVEACEEWEQNQGQWREEWPQAPTIEKVIVFGISEEDHVVNTLDTGRPRTLADVMFRSEYFSKLHKKHRTACAKIADHAIRMMWRKTGAGMDAFAPKRTHSESLDFVERHPKLLECVKHIFEENGDDNKIGTILSPGYASAVMYLMAACLTEADREDKSGYSDSDSPDESLLDMSMYEKAAEFWTLLAAGDLKIRPHVQAAISNSIESGGTCGHEERIGIITNAWTVWTSNKKLTMENIMVQSELDLETGIKTLIDLPRLGGIDIAS